MADNPLSGIWDGIMALPTPTKIVLGVAGVGGGYLVYKHVQGGSNTTAATNSSGTSQLPISSGDTTGISAGGPGYNGNPWGSLAGPAGPPGPAGPAGPPGPYGLYSPPAGGSGTSPLPPVGPVQAFSVGYSPVGGSGGISQGGLPFGHGILSPPKVARR